MALRTENILSLFSGVGGLDLGVTAALRSLGAAPRTVCMVEGEAFGAACLASQMEAGALDACPIWSDVRTFDARAWRGLVDGVTGGFPCQDISLAGTRRGLEGERSGLFFELVRIVRDVRPRWVFLENVSAITLRGLDAVLGELAALGFDAEWCCLRASDVGAPHRRDRWFCLAYRRGNGPQRLEPTGRATRTAFRTCRAKVADAHGGRLEGERRPKREPELSRRDESDRCNVPHRRLCAKPISDAERDELRHESKRGQGRAQTPERGYAIARDSGEPRLAAFPPGPYDRDAWRRILDERPDLAPAIKPGLCRVADGASARVDRLRALGNAVVPAQAEAAFLELWARR